MNPWGIQLGATLREMHRHDERMAELRSENDAAVRLTRQTFKRLCDETARADRAERERDELQFLLDEFDLCGADITHRDEEHRQSICRKANGHDDEHDDMRGCIWTDAGHYPRLVL